MGREPRRYRAILQAWAYGAALAGAGACNDDDDDDDELPAARVSTKAHDDRGEVPSSTAPAPTWPGVITAGRGVDVRAPFTALVESLHVSVGRHVRRGEPVATLDLRAAHEEIAMRRAELRRVQARLAEARVELRRAAQEVARVRELDARALVPAAEVEAAEHEHERLEAVLAGARAESEQIETALARARREASDGRVAAPFDATVARIHVEVGELAAAHAPIVRLLESGAPMVRFGVLVDAMVPAQGTELRVEAADGGQVWSARVVSVQPDGDARTGLVAVEAELVCPDEAQCPHATAVTVALAESIPMACDDISIPSAAATARRIRTTATPQRTRSMSTTKESAD